jgi:hypothetical protein
MKVPILLMLMPVALFLPASLPAQTVISADRQTQIRELRHDLEALSARLAALEAEDARNTPNAVSTTPKVPTAALPRSIAAVPEVALAVLHPEDAPKLAFLRGTTFSFGIDGYYGYNFNAPVGRVNLLRPYDVSSNSFSINQASFIVEHLPTTTERLGGRIDLQFGQATETLQGSSVNEERPQVWRNLFQVYGSYLAPVGREHIFDTYATSNAIPRLTLVGEADFVVNRTYAEQRPGRVVIGSLAARYALPHQWNAGARAEYLDDRGGLFSGTTQALKEVTLVADHTFHTWFSRPRGVPSRLFQSTLLPYGHTGRAHSRPDHCHFGSHVLVGNEAG